MVFIKERFKEIIQLQKVLDTQMVSYPYFTLCPVENNPALLTYYQSILSLLTQTVKPSLHLMEIKMLEMVHLLAQQPSNLPILQYLYAKVSDQEDCLQKVMLHNYMYNLQLADYAQLCNRSLASFKRDFTKCFQVSPGKWLTEQRMLWAARLLKNTQYPISQVAFDSGYEDPSHFTRLFKKHFKQSPGTYRQQVQSL